MSMFCGYGPEPVARAVAGGSQFMMATEDALWIAEELARAVAACLDATGRAADGHQPVATGGTPLGNPASMAASRAALADVLTGDAYAHTHRLAEQLASAIEATIRNVGLPCVTHRLGPRSGASFSPVAPRNAVEAVAAADPELSHAAWAYLANRGVWEALIGAGPTCSVPATRNDVDRYAEAFDSFVQEVRQ